MAVLRLVGEAPHGRGERVRIEVPAGEAWAEDNEGSAALLPRHDPHPSAWPLLRQLMASFRLPRVVAGQIGAVALGFTGGARIIVR